MTQSAQLPMMPAREVVARTLWGEARGEGRNGMAAVACVIQNRARNPRWWGNSPAAVCLKPYQFSCWLPDDPNRGKLLAVTDRDSSYRAALELADALLAGQLVDITNGADHYHTTGVAPAWSGGKKPVAVIGNHRFFRLELK
ncbi:cell wall hydrolase [Azospirillum picis]|uniref:Spore germination cell wall hydrolase CwlJ-like protein n=1 Tax=Azospirillum picis TaxID=488438 RepID=A0ABU0MEB5_9PROT|nr:cell wall hydrolase [Azospirillum picis]MBP2297939.1 spore germination cell wall hydrolase CwlJ-like protein [Azospirillum picis]MDQ0531777.1 spore germination cell wall hydrolase CwlJ-like protein [Azospirillum picis]